MNEEYTMPLTEVDGILEPCQLLGKRLKDARESKGESLLEVADCLHLPQRVIVAMEEGNFTKHPGLIFMRGYLRSYSRYLELSIVHVMEEFEQLHLVDERQAQQPTALSPLFTKQNNINERSMHWVTTIVVLVLVALLVVWWQSHRVDSENGVANNGNLPIATSNMNSPTITPVSPQASSTQNNGLASTSLISAPKASASARSSAEPSILANVKTTKAPEPSKGNVTAKAKQTTKPQTQHLF